MLQKLYNRFKTLFSNDLGIDLGTMNTLVCVAERGIIMDEPSVVACRADSGRVLAVGAEAKKMLGHNPGDIKVHRPVKNGVIADSAVTDKMLAWFIKNARGYFKVMQPRVLVAVPYGITTVEADAVRNSAIRAGAREVRLVAEPFAAAIGTGLPVMEPTPSMVVDIGGGTTEVAMISLGSIVTAESIQCGGDKMDEAIIMHMQQKHNLSIGVLLAEEIKKTIGTACHVEKEESMEIRGMDMGIRNNALPKTITIYSNEIQEALEGPVLDILGSVRRTISNSGPALAADLLKNGITMTGGGSLLKGLDFRIEQETGIPIRIAQHALKAVVNGTSELLKTPEIIFSSPQDHTYGCSN